MNGVRRYATIIQDGRGYPGPNDPLDPAPPEGPKPLELVTVVTFSDHEREVQRAFYRGWTQAMELIEGQGDAAVEMAREALQPCQHDASTGGVCDWCGENVSDG